MYRLTVENTWSEATHPGAVPANAHFSWLAGATHDDSVRIWEVGEPSSAGITEMAETGWTDALVAEITGGDGIDQVLDWPYWFCPEATSNSKCGEPTVEFAVDPDYPYVTLSAMIGPSPDWFVGVDGLALLDDGQWRQAITVVLSPFDAGTRTNNSSFDLFGRQNDPPEPITIVTAESGQLIGPGGIGSYTFELVEGG
jgi:hypothetical protein